MLFLLLKYFLLFFLAFVYGVSVIRLLAKRNDLSSLPVVIYPVIGLAVLATVTNILSLFLAIGLVVKTGVIVIGVLLFFLNFRLIKETTQAFKIEFRGLSLPAKLLFAFATVFVLYLTAQPTLSYDEGLYYIQFIKWAETYPVVPGLANLHHRFGFNSSWHMLTALFNTSSFTGVEENRINGAIYLLMLLHFLPGLLEQNSFLRWLKGGMLLTISLPFLIVYNLTSPNADIIILFLFLFGVDVWVTGLIKNTDNQIRNFLVAILSIFLLTIKPSAIPVLCLPALIFIDWLQKKQFTNVFRFVAISFMIVAPWLVRNIVLSGYILFPFEKLDLFSFDWKVPAENAVEARKMIKDSAYYLYNDNSVLQAGSFAEKIKIWFLRNLRIYDKLFLLIAMLSPFVLFLYRKTIKKEVIWLWLCLLAGMLFWFIQAPDPRFGYAYIITTCLLVLATVASRKVTVSKNIIIAGVFIFQAGTIVLYSYLHKKFIAEARIRETATNTWLMPSPYFAPSLQQKDSVPFVQTPVVGDQCWDAPLPCSAENMRLYQKRGASLADGFRAVNQ